MDASCQPLSAIRMNSEKVSTRKRIQLHSAQFRSLWQSALLASIVVVAITSIPQFMMWIDRGQNWQGVYASPDADELAYAAYLSSLLSGQPRLNNPYLGKQNGSQVTSENLFSIQFFPPYLLALSGRLLGFSTSAIFTALLPISAFASSLAVFWLLYQLTGHKKLSALGVFIVLLCGVLISENPFASEKHFYTFAFLRRYIPALPFPLFFVFCLSVVRAFLTRGRAAILYSFLAGAIFVLLVYSYFYLWTAAAVWFVCFFLVWIVARAPDRKHVLICTLIITTQAILAVAGFVYLLSRRAPNMDRSQVLELTNQPDLLRLSELISFLVIAVVLWGVLRGNLSWTSESVLFALAASITTIVVFNQQIVTGRSIQPFHYDQFIINHLVLAALVVTYSSYRKNGPKHLFLATLVTLGVGLGTGIKGFHLRPELNRLRDEARPIFLRINKSADSEPDPRTFFDVEFLAAESPTLSPVAALWSPFTYTFGNTTTEEELERFYQFLYYSGVDKNRIEAEIRNYKLYQATLFGHGRVYSVLSRQFDGVTEGDIRQQVRKYSDYFDSFSEKEARRWPLSFAVYCDKRNHTANLTRWYDINEKEQIGGCLLYRVSLKSKIGASE